MDESTQDPWHILVVDDDETVLAVTRLVFRRLRLLGRKLKLHCFSDTRSARAFLSERNDIAIGIIDVVMETTTDGFDLIRWIRDQPHLYATRLVVRTGEPGELPEAEVLERYEINDYWPKATLESRRLQTLVLGLLRSYRDIVALREERVASATSRAEAQRAY
jgi:CheY-like chemotaxis protein